MKLLVVRHAPAEDRAAWARRGRDDASRPLTPEGRRKMREAARGIATLVGPPQALATSPLVRARQTADVLARALRIRVVEELDALEPGRRPEALLGWLRGNGRRALAAVVGHEPHLGGLVSWLLAGRGTAFV